MNKDSNLEAIENAVRNRDIAEARKKIGVYLRAEKQSFNAKLKACDWLRRLALYREAYLLITPKTWNLRRATTDETYHQSLLWSARLLNLQGATGYALDLIKSLVLRTPLDHLIAGNIYISSYHHAKAVESFTSFFSSGGESLGYTAKIARVSLADARVGLGDFSGAYADLARVRPDASEKNLEGMIHQARGEYLAREGRSDEALLEFEKAVRFLPASDETPDMAFLLKWRAYALANLGRGEQAFVQFSRALDLLHKPSLRPEMWLDCYYWMNRVKMLDASGFSELEAYPGTARGFYARAGVTGEGVIGEPSASFRIYSSRDEWVQKGQARLGIPKEIEFLALLRRAARFGISIERLKPLLWPDEASAFAQLDARIFQLMKRLKTEYGITTSVQEGVVLLSTDALKEVFVEFAFTPKLPGFFADHPEFEAAEFSKHYGFGRTMTFQRLGEAIEAGWIAKRLVGKKTVYRVVSSGPSETLK